MTTSILQMWFDRYSMTLLSWTLLFEALQAESDDSPVVRCILRTGVGEALDMHQNASPDSMR